MAVRVTSSMPTWGGRLRQLMRKAAGSRRQDLGLCSIQLEPLGVRLL